jgi:hypothetical protein
LVDRRWDDDKRGHGVADARGSLPAIQQLAELAVTKDWVAEDAEAHLLPNLRDRIEISGLSFEAAEVEPDGALRVRLASATKLSREEIRESVWMILGGVAELTSHVRETRAGELVSFEMVTGIPPGDGPFITHGHTLRIEVSQPE